MPIFGLDLIIALHHGGWGFVNFALVCTCTGRIHLLLQYLNIQFLIELNMNIVPCAI